MTRRNRSLRLAYVDYAAARDRAPEPPNTFLTPIRIFCANVANCCLGRTNPDNGYRVMSLWVNALVNMCGALGGVTLMILYAQDLQDTYRARNRGIETNRTEIKLLGGIFFAAISIVFSMVKVSPAISVQIRNFYPLSLFLCLCFLIFTVAGGKRFGNADSASSHDFSIGRNHNWIVSCFLLLYWLFVSCIAIYERDRRSEPPHKPRALSDLNNLPPEILSEVSPIQMPSQSCHMYETGTDMELNNDGSRNSVSPISLRSNPRTTRSNERRTPTYSDLRPLTPMVSNPPQLPVASFRGPRNLAPPAYSPVDPLQSDTPPNPPNSLEDETVFDCRYALRKRSPPLPPGSRVPPRKRP
ncbi:uncharacterized protein V2V93DRAFT_365109 [Kockiozyma suomiensis]|uniref:uncharacterized protein n=1 Tax=Kockiozyma suomiensis TaxID=1337062 RepID=UPI0033441832